MHELLALNTTLHENTLHAALVSAATLYLCSDGGAIPGGNGSFGFVIANQDTILLEGRGPASGTDPRSYRAEGYGMLALICTIKALKQAYHCSDTSTPAKIFCDNKALGDKIRAWPTLVQPNDTIRSDFDVLGTIAQQIQTAKVTAEILHVDGHQTITPHSPWEACLNHRADELATQYLQEQTSNRPTVQPLPSTGIQLQIHGHTVNRHLSKTIRTAALQPALHHHYQQTFKWQPSTADQVDWPLYAAAIQNLHGATLQFVQKFTNRLLPTNHRMLRYGQRTDDHCASCGEREDNSHFFQCPARHQWRTNLLTQIAHRLTRWNATQPSRDHIMYGIAKALGEPSHDGDIDPQWYSRQNQIGWQQLLYGRWTIQLRQLFIPGTTSPAIPPPPWLPKLIRLIWSEMNAVWKQRNDTQHQPTEDATTPEADLTLIDVTTMYRHRHANQLTARDRQRIFNVPQSVRIRQPIHQIRTWLTNAATSLRGTLPPHQSHSMITRQRATHTPRPIGATHTPGQVSTL
jgi:hypothetical protein